MKNHLLLKLHKNVRKLRRKVVKSFEKDVERVRRESRVQDDDATDHRDCVCICALEISLLTCLLNNTK